MMRIARRFVGNDVVKGSLRQVLPRRNVGTISKEEFIEFGKNVFRGAVAAPYLQKHGLPSNILETPDWVRSDKTDQVAAAVLDWARDRGASTYCHWSQPLGSALLRHGQTANVQNAMIEFDKNGDLFWNFKGKHLIKSETDGSSYMNGGLRATHSAAAYVIIDATSPIFLRDDTVFIPSALISYTGHALDEKTPLLKATHALSKEGSRLLKLLGVESDSILVNIGLEQELFFVPREVFLDRPDLKYTGRTVIGRAPARGQELADHYMATPSLASAAIACMQEIQQECYKIGIPLRTRHREVAPNQYEFAPMYGTVTTQIDQNMMVMQIVEEVAIRHGLAALFHEKPFQGVNGSGKHNNWSIATSSGVNLLNYEDVTKATGNADIFPTVLAAIVYAVDSYGDLMRMATACPGNDFRLGACEAPPAITSVYLGKDITSYLEIIKNAPVDQKINTYEPNTTKVDLGVPSLPLVDIPAEDRNRTSSFPFGGHRFEFRSVGSSQNVSMVNTVLCSITAMAFKRFADEIESGKTARVVMKEALNKSWKSIFNGNGYCPENQRMLTEAGLWRFDSGVDAIKQLTASKNIELFEQLGVLTSQECEARQNILFTTYIGVVEMEAQILVDLIQQHILPAVRKNDPILAEELAVAVHTLKHKLHELHALPGASSAELYQKASFCRSLRLETMMEIRSVVDRAEDVTAHSDWPIPKYEDLMFLDHNTR